MYVARNVAANSRFLHLISGFRRNVHEICALLGRYAASSGNPLSMFRDSVLVLYSGVGLLDPMVSWPLKMGMTCSETSAKHYHSVLRNTPEKCRCQGFCSSQASSSGLFSKSDIRFFNQSVLHLKSFLSYVRARRMNIGAADFFQFITTVCQTTRRHIPEIRNLQVFVLVFHGFSNSSTEEIA
jgi:hypothetical protein